MTTENPDYKAKRKEEFLQRERFLNMRRLPARLVPEEVAKGLLKPLGNPALIRLSILRRSQWRN
jgi:hypothetical protein